MAGPSRSSSVMRSWPSGARPVAHEDDAERAVRAAVDLLDAVGGLRTPDGSTDHRPLRRRHRRGGGDARRRRPGHGRRRPGQHRVATPVGRAARVGAGRARRRSGRPSRPSRTSRSATRCCAASSCRCPPGGRSGSSPAVVATAGRRVSRRRSWVATTSCGCSRSCSTRPPATGGRDSSRCSASPGIGKSRLAWELEKYIDGLVEPIYWHQGRSPAYGDGLAFWALGEMVRGRARIAESDPPERRPGQARRDGRRVPAGPRGAGAGRAPAGDAAGPRRAASRRAAPRS